MNSKREPLFTARNRTDASPGRDGETTYAFLDRVAGDYWAQSRDLIQNWANHIADDHDYDDLRARLRKRNDPQFRSAFLELFLHETLLRAGFDIEIHPQMSHSQRRPDFRASHGDQSFILEAISPGRNAEQEATAAKTAALFDSINSLRSENFFLSIDELTPGPDSPRTSRLKKHITEWLKALDPDSISGHADLPRSTWADNGWTLTLGAIPKRKEARSEGSNDRLIGVYAHHEGAIVEDDLAIRAALSSKDNKYGQLSEPFIIAIGTYMWDTDRWGTTNALYGHDAYTVVADAHGGERTLPSRKPDGYFGTPPGWKRTDVSAVLIVNQLMPYGVLRADLDLWLHPAPARALTSAELLPVTTVELSTNQLKTIESAIDRSAFFGYIE